MLGKHPPPSRPTSVSSELDSERGFSLQHIAGPIPVGVHLVEAAENSTQRTYTLPAELRGVEGPGRSGRATLRPQHDGEVAEAGAVRYPDGVG